VEVRQFADLVFVNGNFGAEHGVGENYRRVKEAGRHDA